jgi:hypothetical protein
MARGRKRGAVSATMEEQIQKAQEKVIKTKAAYDTAVESLQKLLDKRDAQRKDELWDAIIKSNKTYEDILQYVVEGIDVDKDVNE